jgi:hypothetical protein
VCADFVIFCWAENNIEGKHLLYGGQQVAGMALLVLGNWSDVICQSLAQHSELFTDFGGSPSTISLLFRFC